MGPLLRQQNLCGCLLEAVSDFLQELLLIVLGEHFYQLVIRHSGHRSGGAQGYAQGTDRIVNVTFDKHGRLRQ